MKLLLFLLSLFCSVRGWTQGLSHCRQVLYCCTLQLKPYNLLLSKVMNAEINMDSSFLYDFCLRVNTYLIQKRFLLVRISASKWRRNQKVGFMWLKFINLPDNNYHKNQDKLGRIPRWQLEGRSRKQASYREILERHWRHTLQENHREEAKL
jgi:hypothetical protein